MAGIGAVSFVVLVFVAAVAAEPLARCWIWTILAWYAGRVVGTTKDPRLYEMVVWRYVCVFFQVWCLWFPYSERLATMPPVNINSNKQGLELPL